MLLTGCGKRWAESEPNDSKIVTRGGTVHPPSRGPDKRNDILDNNPAGQTHFSVVYFSMIIRAFLAPEPRGTERIRSGHALPLDLLHLQINALLPLHSITHPPITFPAPPPTYPPPPLPSFRPGYFSTLRLKARPGFPKL